MNTNFLAPIQNIIYRMKMIKSDSFFSETFYFYFCFSVVVHLCCDWGGFLNRIGNSEIQRKKIHPKTKRKNFCLNWSNTQPSSTVPAVKLSKIKIKIKKISIRFSSILVNVFFFLVGQTIKISVRVSYTHTHKHTNTWIDNERQWNEKLVHAGYICKNIDISIFFSQCNIHWRACMFCLAKSIANNKHIIRILGCFFLVLLSNNKTIWFVHYIYALSVCVCLYLFFIVVVVNTRTHIIMIKIREKKRGRRRRRCCWIRPNDDDDYCYY